MIALLLHLQALAGGFTVPPMESQSIPECRLRTRSTGRFGPVPASAALSGRQRVASGDASSWIAAFQEEHGEASAVLDAACPEVAAVLVYATDPSAVDPVRLAAYGRPALPCDEDVAVRRRRLAGHLAGRPPSGRAKYVVLARGVTGLHQYVAHYDWDNAVHALEMQAERQGCDISVGDGAPIPQ